MKNAPYEYRHEEGEDVDLAKIILMMWSHRKWIMLCVGIFTALGIAYAIFATPIYRSQATIAPKEREQGIGMLTQFSSVVGATGLHANTTLSKINIILKGHTLAHDLITEHSLLPTLFPEKWDSTRGRWYDSRTEGKPTIRDGVKRLRGMLETSIEADKGVLRVEINSTKAELSKRLVELYLDGLNKRIREDAISTANAERLYLEEQLQETADPQIADRIQSMIARQIETSMLLRSQAFDVLEHPIVPDQRISPQRKKVVVVSLVLGFVFACMGVFLYRGYDSLRDRLILGQGK